MEKFFTKTLMYWHTRSNKREMPWKGEKDPYKIWLSEIILQQTRVAQGLAYYNRFIEQFPDIRKLAAAKDKDVFKLWEGLGYYTRCKNLLFTARSIVNGRGGVFPDTYDEILTLKGVGPYTAAAIASFGFGLPYAVVDGNVFRVLSRFFGISEPIDSNKGKKLFTELAGKVIAVKTAGEYNQAIMDFGATVCKPFAPGCANCCLRANCKAFQEGTVNRLPVKEKTMQRKNRWFSYFIFWQDGKVLLQERTGKDIWQNLHEFYLLETDELVKWDKSVVNNWLAEQLGVKKAVVKNISPAAVQQLTHQQIKGQFIEISLAEVPSSLAGYRWYTLHTMRKLAFPKLITQYLETHPDFTANPKF